VFCAKCSCRTLCGHVIPGKVAMVFIHRTPGPYTTVEIIVTGIALLLLIGLPQIWLWQYTGLFITFWVLIGIAVIQIRTVICRGCDNTYCPARSR
jgi:hypothetical protein